MVQLAKCLPYKQEGLSSDPWHPVKSQALSTQLQSLYWESEDRWPASLACLVRSRSLRTDIKVDICIHTHTHPTIRITLTCRELETVIMNQEKPSELKYLMNHLKLHRRAVKAPSSP